MTTESRRKQNLDELLQAVESLQLQFDDKGHLAPASKLSQEHGSSNTEPVMTKKDIESGMEKMDLSLQEVLKKLNVQHVSLRLVADDMTTVEDVLDLTAKELTDQYGLKFGVAKKLLRELKNQ